MAHSSSLEAPADDGPRAARTGERRRKSGLERWFRGLRPQESPGHVGWPASARVDKRAAIMPRPAIERRIPWLRTILSTPARSALSAMQTPEFTRWQRSTEWGREPYRPAAARSIATRANALLGNCRIVFGWPTWDPASGSDSAAAGWLSASALRSSGTMIPVGSSVQTAGHQDNTCARSA